MRNFFLGSGAFLLGAVPGLLLGACASLRQGIGIGLIAGTVGLALWLSKRMENIEPGEALARGVGSFFKIMIAKNVPGGDQILSAVEREEEPPSPLVVSRTMSEPGFHRNLTPVITAGAVIFGTVAAGTVWYAADAANELPNVLERIFLVVIVAVMAVALGGLVVGALYTLAFRGPHRQFVLSGLLLGTMIGVGFVTAVSGASHIPLWQAYTIFGGLCGSAGISGGFIAGLGAEEKMSSIDRSDSPTLESFNQADDAK